MDLDSWIETTKQIGKERRKLFEELEKERQRETEEYEKKMKAKIKALEKQKEDFDKKWEEKKASKLYPPENQDNSINNSKLFKSNQNNIKKYKNDKDNYIGGSYKK